MNEWDNEDDRYGYLFCGYVCEIRRTPEVKILCGYVTIPSGHPLHGRSYTEDGYPNLEVHGGITYSGFNEDKHWEIGFDCGHWQDLVPGAFEKLGWSEGTYRNRAFVEKELARLAAQVLDLGVMRPV